MRAFHIVTVTTAVKLALAMLETGEIEVAQQFELQGSMKTLILALSLGMVSTAMNDPDAQPYQPQAQGCPAVFLAMSPGRTVVHQHRLGQATADPRPGRPAHCQLAHCHKLQAARRSANDHRAR